MRETQETINQWQNATFPEATPQGVTRHLLEEIDEFCEIVCDPLNEDRPLTDSELNSLIFEAVDMIILIYAWADKHGVFDIHKMVDAKMAINRQREWNIQPDGTGRHK